MRYLLISDVHANLAAFEAVLEDAEGQYDKVWCLGDMVGYGPDPNAVMELIREIPNLTCLLAARAAGTRARASAARRRNLWRGMAKL